MGRIPPEGGDPGAASRSAAAPAPGVKPKPARPSRGRRAQLGFIGVAGTLGVVGVATAIAAILGSQDVDAWIVGLVASVVTVALAGALWRWLRGEAAGTKPTR
jgi:hypothetical protein